MTEKRAGEPGVLVAIGGAEDKTSEAVILRRILDLVPGPDREVGVIATASGYPQETFDAYNEAFGRLGASVVHDLDVRTRADAHDEALVALTERCDVIFLSGGDQLRLTHILGGSLLLSAIRRRRDQGAVIAGTSAGAAAMSATMIYNGHAADALRKGAVKMSSGLAFVRGIIIDSHFLERGRFTRLMEVGTTNPEYIGVGIGEDAAVIIHEGPVLEAIGNGHVIVVDSAQVKTSNVFQLSDGEPVAVEHVIMHALTSGFAYDVRARRFLAALAPERS